MTKQYIVTAPSTPGATPSTQCQPGTLAEARDVARRFSDRRDLNGQDVRIEDAATGKRFEYAGPAR